MTSLQKFSLPGAMLERGFWLYVWWVESPVGELLYVGRTGDNSSPHATAPYTRMGQHLGFAKNQNALRKHLSHRDVEPESCEVFDLVAHGPIYSEIVKDGSDRSVLMERHKPFRNQVGAMEKLLCDDLKTAGYSVMNTVNCRFHLDEGGEGKWKIAKAAFREEFPLLS